MRQGWKCVRGGDVYGVQRVSAIKFLRRLRGGSQPILVLGSDGLPYVVKFSDNPQGPNLPFNEVVGTELFRRFGLSSPEWCLMDVSEAFLNDNPACWFEEAGGLRKPAASPCFGSRFIGLNGSGLLEIIPQTHFNRIQNRRDFLKAWVLDALCEHSDHRQAVFLQGASLSLHAWFIDHGHLLGGADGRASAAISAAMYLDCAIYVKPECKDADEIEFLLRGLDGRELKRMTEELPEEWKTPVGEWRLANFQERLTDRAALRSAVRTLLGLLECVRSKSDDRRPTILPLQPKAASVRPHLSAVGLCSRHV